MNLNINSPAYFSVQFGIDDEIYWFCRDLSEYVKDKVYSEDIDTIGIVPVVAPKEELEKGLWKESKKCEKKYRFASISLQIDFEKYFNADVEERKMLIIDNLLKSVKAIQRKGGINYKEFEKDIMKFCAEKGIDFDV